MTARAISKRDGPAPPPTTANLKLSPFLRPIKVQPTGSQDARDVAAAPTMGQDDSPSAFALVPPVACDSLAQLSLFLPHALSDYVSRYVPPGEASWEARCRALFAHLGGGAGGFGVVVFAVLANHVRRAFWPGSVVGGFGGPIGMLKLAAGSPGVFLREEFETGRWWWGWQKVVGDLGGLGAGAELVRRVREGRGTGDEGRRGATVAAVGVLVWALGAAEYVHARSAHVVALGIAYWKLLGGGGEGGREVLWRIFVPSEADAWSEGEGLRRFVTGFWRNEDAIRILAFHAEVVGYCVWGLGPLIWLAVREAVGLGRRGWRPVLAVVMGGWAWGTGYVARYSNKYYIGLQMYEMVLVAWWIGAAACVFGLVWVRGVVGRGRKGRGVGGKMRE